MRKLFVTALLLMVAVGVLAFVTATPTIAAKGNCSTVRCAGCPDGYHLRLHWPNCCDCIPN